MTNSNEFGIGKITDCKRCSDLRFVRNLKYFLTGKEKTDGEVALIEMRNCELKWLKFEQYFIMQDRDHPFKYVRKMFQKIVISYPLIRTLTLRIRGEEIIICRKILRTY